MKEKLFQIFFSVYIFWTPILFSIFAISRMQLDVGIMRVVLISQFAISWYFFLSIKPHYPEERKMLFILALFAIAYYSTQFFYDNTNPESKSLYMGQFFSWGSRCTSACVVGMTLVKVKDYSLIHKIVPYVCFALTPLFLNIILSNSAQTAQYTDEGGLNYQHLAYYMAVLFCFSLFYSVIYKDKQPLFIRIIAFCLILVQSVASFMSGGRGGLVLLLVYVLYMLFFILKKNIISKQKLLLIVAICVLGFLCVANNLGMWSSAGFSRSSGFVDDDDRFVLWSEYMPYIMDSPILGNGLGSDYFTCGFYSHNLIVDFLVEMGVIGAIFMIWVYWKTYNIIFLFTGYNETYVIILILFIFGFVINLFSGYWIHNTNTWLCFGVAISSANYFNHHIE